MKSTVLIADLQDRYHSAAQVQEFIRLAARCGATAASLRFCTQQQAPSPIGAPHIAALGEEAERAGVLLLPTPWDLTALSQLCQLSVPLLHLPGHLLTDPQALELTAATGRPIIAMAGLCTMPELKAAASYLKQLQAGPLTVLQSGSQGEVPADRANLRAMVLLKGSLQCSVGYADHTRSIEAAIAAVAIGAEVVQKPVHLDSPLPHTLSMEEFAGLAAAIRRLGGALGTGRRDLIEQDLIERSRTYTGLAAARPIAAGQTVTADDLCVAAGGGLSPLLAAAFISAPAPRDYAPGDPIDLIS